MDRCTALIVLSGGIAVPAAAAPSYVGAAACAKCHAEVYSKWSASRHSKMVQPATPQGIRGDFSRSSEVVLRGSPYGLRERAGVYYITESFLTGHPQEHRVDYTLGNQIGRASCRERV